MRKLALLLGVLLLAGWIPACSAQNGQDPVKSPTATTTAPAAPAAAVAQPAAPVELKTQKDKISYIFGLNIGRNLQQQKLEVDPELIARGLRDAAPGVKSLLSDEEIQATMEAFQKEMLAKQEALIKELSEKNKKAGAEFLARNAKEPGVQVTQSGLQYKMTTEGTGDSPKATDTVKVIYTGKLLDGKEFGGSNGEAVEIPLEQVFPGWVEGMQLMKVGGEATLWIPGELAYQDFAPPGMEPYATLIMDVKLVEIMPPAPAEEAPVAPATPEAPK